MEALGPWQALNRALTKTEAWFGKKGEASILEWAC